MGEDGSATWQDYWGWSVSKQSQWETCPKQYWYATIRSFDFRYGSVQHAELRHLKGLATRPMLLGRIVHEAIDKQLKLHRLTRELDKAEARRFVQRSVDAIRDDPEGHLVEAVNGLEVGSLSDLEAEALDLLDTFFEMAWPRVSDRTYLEHEEFEEMEIAGHRIRLKPDLVTRDRDGTVVITDWKTGTSTPDAEGSLQLGTYVLWATRRYGVEADLTRGEIVDLRSGTVDRAAWSPTDLEALRDRVAEQARRIFEAEAFPADPGERKCRSCPFATICEEGRVHLPEGTANPYRPADGE